MRLLLLVALLALAAPAQAIMIGVGPSSLQYSGANRGGQYTQTLIASTQDGKLRCALSASGDAAAWITFDNTTFLLSGQKQAEIPVHVSIPETAPNGQYKALIELRASPSSEDFDGTGMNVEAAVYVSVTVTVSGSETAWYRVLKVSAANTKEGQPIKAEITVRNNAGKGVKPTIYLRALNRDRMTQYASATFSEATVAPQTKETLAVEIPSGGMKSDLYIMEFKVDADGQNIWSSQEPFYITPADSQKPNMRIEGVLEDAKVTPNNMSLGAVMNVEAQFTNTGDLPLDATLRVDVLRGDTPASSEKIVSEYLLPGESRKMAIKYRPQLPGDYSLLVWVEYPGGRTAVRQATVKVYSLSPPLIPTGMNFYLIALPIFLLIILWGIVYYKKYYAKED